MVQKIKEQLFTLSGLFVTCIHVLILIGGLSSYVFFRVEVLGNDMKVTYSRNSK